MDTEKVCACCGKRCVPAQSFCPKCGAALPAAIPRPARAASAPRNHRTVELSSIEEYLADVPAEYRAAANDDPDGLSSRFPYSVVLKVAFPELDFANRWCWKTFGPCDGECRDRDSEYRVCDRPEPHSHAGKWAWDFLGKESYNFGFCEWYFAEPADRDAFVANVDKIDFGEHYPISQD